MAEIRGQPVLGLIGQALTPVSAVTKEDSNPSLLPKQEGRLDSWCLITVYPPFAHWIISKIIYFNLTWKSEKNNVSYSSVLQFSSKNLLQLGVRSLWTQSSPGGHYSPPYLGRNYYGHKMWALRWAWKIAQINNRHQCQLKFSKFWEPFWSYQLNSLAKPADSPHLFGELADSAGLFGL